MNQIHPWSPEPSSPGLDTSLHSSAVRSPGTAPIRALAQDLLLSPSPVHALTDALFALMAEGLETRPTCQWHFHAWDDAEGELRTPRFQIALAPLTDWHSVHAPVETPTPALPHRPQSPWAVATPWLHQPTEGSLLAVMQTFQRQFPKASWRTQAQALAASMAVWAMARQVDARECDMTRNGFFVQGHPHGLTIALADASTEGYPSTEETFTRH